MLVPTELFWAYLVAISLLTVTPGVDTLLVMRNAGRGGLKHGLRDGCVTSVGICCGLFIHATLSALGISVLLVETAWAFTAVKWAGACYLIWLGLSSLRQAMARGPANADESSISSAEPPLMKPVSIWVAFREGLLSNVLIRKRRCSIWRCFLSLSIPPGMHSSNRCSLRRFTLCWRWPGNVGWRWWWSNQEGLAWGRA